MNIRRTASPLLAFLCALWLGATGRPALGIEIGSVSELDLGEMRSLIEGSAPARVSRVEAGRPIALAEAIRVALENNLRLQISTLDVDAQERELAASRGIFHPTIGAQALKTALEEEPEGLPVEHSNTYAAQGFARQFLPTGASVTVAADYLRDDPAASAVDETVSYVLEGRQPLLRGGRTYVARRPILDAGHDLEIEQAQLSAEVLQVTAETKSAYYNAVLADRLIEIVRLAIERDEELLEASEALFEAGRVNQRDVLSAQIQLASDSADLATRIGDKEIAQNQLREVLGLPIDVPVAPTDRKIPFRPIALELDSWIGRALENRPELLEIRKRLEKSELEIRNRRNDVLPALDLFGAYRQDHDLRRRDWEAGVLVEIPFGNVAARNQLARARALHARTEREYVQQERQIELEVREIEIRLRENLDRVKARTAEVENARRKRELAQVRFQLGLANNFDITDASDELVSAEVDLLQAVVEHATNLAFLEARIAGPI